MRLAGDDCRCRRRRREVLVEAQAAPCPPAARLVDDACDGCARLGEARVLCALGLQELVPLAQVKGEAALARHADGRPRLPGLLAGLAGGAGAALRGDHPKRGVRLLDGAGERRSVTGDLWAARSGRPGRLQGSRPPCRTAGAAAWRLQPCIGDPSIAIASVHTSEPASSRQPASQPPPATRARAPAPAPPAAA